MKLIIHGDSIQTEAGATVATIAPGTPQKTRDFLFSRLTEIDPETMLGDLADAQSSVRTLTEELATIEKELQRWQAAGE